MSSKIVTYEVVPPRKVNISKILAKINRIAGFLNAINITDTPLGIPRVSSIPLAVYLQEKFKNLIVIPHLKIINCNVVGLKSLILGLRATGVKYVLLIKGDRPSEGTTVSDMSLENAVKYAKVIGLRVIVGIGKNTRERLEQALSMNPDIIATQPFLSEEEISNFFNITKELRSKYNTKVKVIGSLIVFSPKNFQVIKAISGNLDQKYTFSSDYLKLRTTKGLILKILDLLDGVYISSPFDFDSVVEVLSDIREDMVRIYDK